MTQAIDIYGMPDDEQSRAYLEYDEDTLQMIRLVLPTAEKCPTILISKPDGTELIRIPMYSTGEIDMSAHTMYEFGSVGIEEIFNG